MNFLLKIVQFFKDFAKPIPGRHGTPLHATAVNVTSTYKELHREFTLPASIVTNEPTHITHEVHEVFTSRHIIPIHEEEHVAAQPVIVLPEIITLAAPAPVEMLTEPVIEHTVEFVMADVAPTHGEGEEKPKKTRKPRTSASTKTKKPVSTKKTGIKAKKTSTKAKISRPRAKKKAPIPPEAMGFGF